jgi:anti-anti-sigma regulatory factor
MKRLFQEEKWKRQSARRSAEELAKRGRSKSRDRATTLPSPRKNPSIYVAVEKKNRQVTIPAPACFDLRNNTEETLKFFNTLNLYTSRQTKIYLDLSQVQQLSTDVIGYLLSRLEPSKQHGYNTEISGNNPKEPKCNELFRKSGFYNYVRHNRNAPLFDKDVYAIESGHKVEPRKAAEIKRFVAERLPEKAAGDLRRLYETVVECMANTNNHAYPEDRPYKKWWLTALFNSEKHSVQITFLDNGLTIPSTMRRDFHEQIRKLFANVTGVGDVKDFRLIESALKGRFRTRTKQRSRGKGLPRIYKSSREDKIKDLLIVSKRGYLDYSENKLEELPGEFHGTLLRWEMY